MLQYAQICMDIISVWDNAASPWILMLVRKEQEPLVPPQAQNTPPYGFYRGLFIDMISVFHRPVIITVDTYCYYSRSPSITL